MFSKGDTFFLFGLSKEKNHFINDDQEILFHTEHNNFFNYNGENG